MKIKRFLIKSTKSKFTHNLNEYLRKISEIKILSICLPNTNYLINERNNVFEFFVNDNKYQIKLENQDVYNIDSFLQNLENKVNSKGIVEFTFSYFDETNKIKITTSDNVKINFSKGMAKLLGFKEGLTELSNEFNSDNVVNFNKCLYYTVILEDFNESIVYYNNVEPGCLLINEIPRIIKLNDKINLQTLDIRLLDDEDKYVDFNGIEWSMYLEITYEN